MKQNDWNLIDIEKLQNNDKNEVEKFYYINKEYLMRIFKNDEELYNDWFMQVLRRVKNYDPKKGKFNSWITKVAFNELKDKYSKKPIKIETISYDDLSPCFLNTIPTQSHDDKDVLDEVACNISEADKEFMLEYTAKNITRCVNTRMKFYRLLKKVNKKN